VRIDLEGGGWNQYRRCLGRGLVLVEYVWMRGAAFSSDETGVAARMVMGWRKS